MRKLLKKQYGGHWSALASSTKQQEDKTINGKTKKIM